MDVEILNELKKLKSDVKKEIERLKVIKNSEGLRIKDRELVNSLNLKQELQCISINEEVAKKVCDFPPWNDKHQALTAKNLGELIEYSGGVKKARQRVETSLKMNVFLEPNDQTRLYAEQLYQSLCEIYGVLDRYPRKEKRQSAGFCILCWREVDYEFDEDLSFQRNKGNGAIYYCKDHKLNKSLAQTHRRKLFEQVKINWENEYKSYCALKDVGVDNFSLNLRLSGWLKLFSKSPSSIILRAYNKREEALFRDNWIEYSSIMLQVIKEHYPSAFNLIRRIDPNDSKNWLSFFSKIRTVLDPKMLTVNNDWLRAENNHLDYMLIMAVIARYEAFCNLYPNELDNNKLILDLYKQNIEKFGKPKMQDIATRLGLTRQYVHKVIANS